MDAYVNKFQKKVFLTCFCIVVVILLIVFFTYRDNDVGIPAKDTITKINIRISPDTGDLDDYVINNKKDIDTIVNFFNSINVIETVNKQDTLCGGSYDIEFYVQDNQTVNVFLGMFLTVDGQEWKVSYEKVSEFARLIAEIIYKQYSNHVAYSCLKGKITELYNEDEQIKDAHGFEVLSRRRICMIDTNNEKIDISCPYIYNFKKSKAFNGPKKGDKVEIYRKKGERDANAIFILS